ncbi:MAG: PAS domain-containing protein [Gemmatimonadota bacterium]|nr:PAS domain-containing protein [Gemmatimonadota bacterium]
MRSAPAFFAGHGEMAARTLAHDWASTPVGPPETWSASLRTTVSTLLASRHAMFLWWGPELIQFYNDGYRPSMGPDRHPSALGARGRECWAEIWPIIGPEVESIMAGGEATWHEDHLVPITRGDRVYDIYWSYSYSPVRDDDGSVGGVLVTVQETTQRVVAERRTRLLQRLAAGMLHTRSIDDVCATAMATLQSARDDISLVRIDLGGTDTEAAPDVITVPLATPPRTYGRLVIGLNPRVVFDDSAVDFVGRVAHEITRALESARRAADARGLLEEAFELAPAFLAVLRGPAHVFEYVNPAYAQIIRHRAVLGQPMHLALPEIVEQGFLELLDRVYATGEPVVGNETLIRLQQPGGAAPEARYVSFVYQAMRDADDEIAGVLVTGTDVTALVEERHRVERVLAETERLAAERDAERRQLRTVLEQAPLAIAITGPAGEIRFANPTFERLWGRAAEDTAAATYSDAYTGYHLDGRPIASEEWAGARAVLKGEVVEGEVIEIVQSGSRGLQGRTLTVWISAAPIRDGEGRIAGAVVMLRDVTAERRTEQQLRDAQRLQAVGTLAGGVAHEVNNALQGTLGFGAFVLQALGPNHPVASDMKLVLESAERAARVSQQLLAYTRQQVTRPQRIDVHALAAGLRPVLQQLLGADKSLGLATRAPGVPRIEADPSQVEQVLINLVANARDALETGGRVTISVDVRRLDEAGAAEVAADTMGFRPVPGTYVRLTVADNGHGMAPETLARIFDPFFTTKPVGEGTGLGLSMVYGTVKQHDGFIRARSAPGRGTSMELHWPAAAADSPLGGDDHSGTPASEDSGTGRTVLVADDEPMVRGLVARVLEMQGCTVLAVEDGAAALELLEQGVRPDLIITDVIMPRLNGRQLHDAAAARLPGVPVLFISGHTGQEAVLQRLVPTGAPFLQKPFTLEALAERAAELMAGAAER